jgi:hypothetical protein
MKNPPNTAGRKDLFAHLPIKSRRSLGCQKTATLFALVALELCAQTGSVTGVVVDKGTGKFLQGAEVLAPNGVQALTDRTGTFILNDVPTGSQELTVSYSGLQQSKVNAVVADGQTTSVSTVRLDTEILELEKLEITSMREGMSQAVALQKASIQYKVVAAADQFGEISEGNVGEYLKFLPGVTIDYNVNDARGVSLRGLSTAFTIVAVDGTPMAGASSVDDTRRFEFEQIAMSNVETTELYKTVTPDLPATATGGFVNFVTKSAFDHEEVQRITYNVSFNAPSSNFSLGKKDGVWGNDKEYVVRPNLDVNFSRKITPKLGLNVAYRFSEKYDDAPRIIENWTITGRVPTLTQYNIQDEQKLTHRESLGTKLEFRPTDATSVFVGGQWNYYNLLFTQRGLSFNLGSNSTLVGDTVKSGTSGTRNVTNGQLQRRKHGETYHFNSGLIHDFGSAGKISVTPYVSRADGYYDDVAEGFISSSQTLSYSALAIEGISDITSAGNVTVNNGARPTDDLRDLGNYTFSNTATGTNLQSRPWEAIDEKNGVNGSYIVEVDEITIPVTFNTGFALDRVNREITRPTYRGAVASITGDTLRALQDAGYTEDVAFGFGSVQAVDPYLVYETYGGNLSAIPSVNDLRDIQEQNYAGYLRMDFQVTPKLLVIGGARYELREIDATASLFSNNIQQKPATTNLDFDGLYPSLSFKFTPVRQIAIRGGVSQTIGVPDYSDILPIVDEGAELTVNDGKFTLPSPDLGPYHSTNYDLGLDYYLNNSGVAGVAIFRKNITDAIVPRSLNAVDTDAVAAQYGYASDVFSTGVLNENSNQHASINGFELSYAQNFTFLPSPFNGLSIQTNYTYVDVGSKDLDTEYSLSRAVAPQAVNVVLGYRYRRFSTTITNNWVDEQLYGGFVNTSYFSGSGDNRLLRYKDELITTDVKVEYAFMKHLSAYVVVRNIFNNGRQEFFRGYTADKRDIELPMRYGEFGDPYITFGIRGTF